MREVRRATLAGNGQWLWSRTEYDSQGRAWRRPSGRQVTTEYRGLTQNRLDALTYPSGLVVKHLYNAYGALQELRKDSGSGTRYWRADHWDETGQVDEYTLSNGIVSSVYRDPAVGKTELIRSGVNGGGSVQDWYYEWDENGNTKRRENAISSVGYVEEITYDALDRLYSTQVTALEATTTRNTRYDPLGNIVAQDGVGTYSYTSGRPHAVSGTSSAARTYSYDNNGNMLAGDAPAGQRTYVWASYNLPTQVTQGSNWSTFTYGPSREKLRQSSYASGLGNRSILYLSGLSEKHTTDSGDEYREYVVAPTGTVTQTSYFPASNTRTHLYLHSDALGTIDAVSNSAGQNMALIANATAPGMVYDRWGKRS